MQNSFGLTLLELLITISIIVIVVFFGVPAFTSIQKNIQLKGAAESSYFAFQQARVAAISKNIDITVALRSGEDWCAAISDKGVCDCNIQDACTMDGIEYKVAHDDYRFVSLDKVTFGADNIAVFDANRGLSIGHAGSAIFSDGTEQLKLILSNMGRVRICSVANGFSGYDPC